MGAHHACSDDEYEEHMAAKGRKGGRAKVAKGFARFSREKLQEAARKGGTKSRKRRKVQ